MLDKKGERPTKYSLRNDNAGSWIKSGFDLRTPMKAFNCSNCCFGKNDISEIGKIKVQQNVWLQLGRTVVRKRCRLNRIPENFENQTFLSSFLGGNF